MKSSDFSPVAGLMRGVGDALLEWRDDPDQRRILAPAEYKTVADRKAHDLIVAGLQDLFPGVPVLSEEAAWDDERPETYWLIDPIDGTASWYEGFVGFATQAAFIHRGTPIYGIVHAPAMGKTWEGVRAEDLSCAWLNGVILKQLVLSNRLLLCDNYPEPRRAAGILNQRLPCTGYLESGSLGIKCCLVADGTADLFVKDVVVRDWDIAPVAPIMANVGGVLCLPNGMEFSFEGPMEKPLGILAARDKDLASLAINALAQQGN